MSYTGEVSATCLKNRCSPERPSLPQVWMRNRWYSIELGRFLSRDPIGLSGGANGHSYGENNPVRYVDPFGLEPSCLTEGMFPRRGVKAKRTEGLLNFLSLDAELKLGVVPQIRAMIHSNQLKVTYGKSSGPQGNFGYTMPGGGEIQINSDLPDYVAAMTLYHEFLHVAVERGLALVPKEFRNLKSPRLCDCDDDFTKLARAQADYLLALKRAHAWVYYEEMMAYRRFKSRLQSSRSSLHRPENLGLSPDQRFDFLHGHGAALEEAYNYGRELPNTWDSWRVAFRLAGFRGL